MRRLTLPRLRLWWERVFWVIPLSGVLLGVLLHTLTSVFDELTAVVLESAQASAISGAAAGQVLAAIGGGMVTFTGFVFRGGQGLGGTR